MERVETLLQQLQQQFNDKAPAEQLLQTVKMLQHELSFLQSGPQAPTASSVMVSMPLPSMIAQKAAVPVVADAAPAPEEKTIEVLQVDEKEIAAELEEIKRNASMMQQISGNSRPQLLFEAEENDVPTLNQQVVTTAKEINETVSGEAHSINERLKEKKVEISERLTASPVKDLRKAIGINDRFLYINDLFRGDEAMYERSIKTINGFSIWPEAEYWIRRELKTKLGWTEDDEAVKQFDQLVKRRFA
ncbi:MAG: hypothetical protein ABIN94_06185 [Ferruginibacter sp.]